MQTLLLAALVAVQAPAETTYRVELVRAAPGQLLELIELYETRMPYYDAAGERRPAIIRHSQGDHWDLMVIAPIGSIEEYFAPARIERRREASARMAGRGGMSSEEFARARQSLVAWREETFFEGPPFEDLAPRFRDAGLFHVEMFIALPGKLDALLEQRRMENAYLGMIGRDHNAIFRKRMGGAWDVMTIGLYRDLPHFAAGGSATADQEEIAAKAAGFRGAGYIGSYLRSLILRHNDTLAVPVRP